MKASLSASPPLRASALKGLCIRLGVGCWVLYVLLERRGCCRGEDQANCIIWNIAYGVDSTGNVLDELLQCLALLRIFFNEATPCSLGVIIIGG